MNSASPSLGPFAGAEYQRLLAAARRSLERTGGELAGTISVLNPTDGERKAIIGVTGQYRDAGAARVSARLADLDGAVREVTGRGLAELLAALGGPLRNRPAERAALDGGRHAAIGAVQASHLHDSCSWYRSWLAEITADGTLTRLVNHGEQVRVAQAVHVLEYLAARGGTPILLPALAAEVTGDTKALNPATVTSTLVLRALGIRAGLARPETAQQRREVWESIGVVVDDLASRVLVLNLPAQGTGLGEWLTGAARLGVPFYATLHQLMTTPLAIPGACVRVCENPAVLRRAAAELGASSSPLLCTEGRPSVAFHRLADVIAEGGGELSYHGDFDWPGVAIASSVMRRHRALPWRMTAADYLAGIRADAGHVPLSGPAQPTPWDARLGEVMVATGCAVYEEAVADPLITDLLAAGPLLGDPVRRR